MTNYLICDTEQDADDVSQAAWEDVLGRPKYPEDVTQYLWERRVGLDGRTAIIVNEREDLVPISRGGGLVETVDPINWPETTQLT